MKTNKIIFTITIAISLILATLCGCMETNDAQSNEDGLDIICFPAQLRISFNDNTNFKDEMINHIEKSKTMSKEDDERENYGVYYINKISELREFYILDKLTIKDYRLYVISINKSAFLFRFVPVDNWKNEGFIEHDEDDIWMSIYRPNGIDASDELKSIIEDSDIQGNEYSYDGDILYYQERGVIFTQMGNTLFNIQVPQELNSYEYLRDLAFKVIETAELVTVGE